jgi:hypothetical protein
VHNPDDQFEAYLKRFQPLIPDPLPALEHTRVVRRLPWLAGSIAAVALMTIGGVLVWRVESPQVVVPVVTKLESSDMRPPIGPLTQQNTNEWLVRAPSFKTAIDHLGFRPETSSIQQGKQSAVAVLSEERIKL